MDFQKNVGESFQLRIGIITFKCIVANFQFNTNKMFLK